VGKSINIKTRVLSHFYQDHQTQVDHHLSHQLHHIEHDDTPTDFGAQILESQQVKALSPSLNRRLKKVTKLYQYQVVEENGYLNIKIQTANQHITQENVYGLFRSRRQASNRLQKLVDEYLLCQRLSGLEKSRTGACFAHQLKKCLGACCQKEPATSYNFRVEKAMHHLRKQQWPYKSAILVEESNPVTQLKAFHLINNWCYLGQIKSAEELWSWEPMIQPIQNPNHQDEIMNDSYQSTETLFDLDLYFILIRFLLSEDLCRKNGLRVHVLDGKTSIHYDW